MARAKRTQRADARRRYRATTGTTPVETDELDDDVEETAPAPSRTRDARPRPRTGGPATARPGLFGALRKAAGPADIRGDIRALPNTALHSKAVWVPLVAIAAAGLMVSISSISSNPIAQVAFQIVLYPPPMIVAFLAGMLAPRGAWLVGGLMAVVAAMVYDLTIILPSTTQVISLGWTFPVPDSQKLAIGTQELITSLFFGLAVGAFAGFYRRFLTMSSPARTPARAGGSARPAARRR